jgi:hypothetical protein
MGRGREREGGERERVKGNEKGESWRKHTRERESARKPKIKSRAEGERGESEKAEDKIEREEGP